LFRNSTIFSINFINSSPLTVEYVFSNTKIETGSKKSETNLQSIVDFIDKQESIIGAIKNLKDPALFDKIQWESLRKFIDRVENENMALIGAMIASKTVVHSSTYMITQFLYPLLKKTVFKYQNLTINITLLLGIIVMLYTTLTRKTSSRTTSRRRTLKRIKNKKYTRPIERLQIHGPNENVEI